jgi:ribosomal protein L37AE/L43A
MVDPCPECEERAVVPILNNKYKCKECDTYFDLAELMKYKDS